MTIVAPVDVSTLSIVRLVLRANELYRFAGRTGLLAAGRDGRGRADIGYLVHGALQASFGEFAPRPFYVLSNRERQSLFRSGMDVAERFVVLTYTPGSVDQLRSVSDSRESRIIDWDQTESKAMPTSFPEGKRLAFAIQGCPIVRTRIFRRERDEPSAEIDAYVAAYQYYEQEGHGEPPNRMEVYQAWMIPKLEAAGVVVESIQVAGFRLVDVTRRNAGRMLESWRRPSVEYHGVLVVSEAHRFREVIRTGIGRHRAFGFGMLRLSPA